MEEEILILNLFLTVPYYQLAGYLHRGRLAVEISSVQIKKRILFEKEDSKQEIRIKKGLFIQSGS